MFSRLQAIARDPIASLAWLSPAVVRGIWRWLRWPLAALLLGVLWGQLAAGGNVWAIWAAVGQAWQAGRGPWLAWTLVLLPLNWALETAKWQVLLRPWGKLPWSQALPAVLAGVGVSVLTPNRMGEYAGRMLAVEAPLRWGVGLSSLAGSVCQWLVFVGMGWPALAACSAHSWGWPVGWTLLLALPAPMLVLAGVYGWERWRGYSVAWWPTSGRWAPLAGQLSALRALSRRGLSQALALAACRFGVYCLQYYLLLRFFGLDLSWAWGLPGIAAIYLVQAGLPLPPGLGVLTRAEMAILLWGQAPAAAAAILAATLALFVINLGIPALLGVLVIVKKT